MASRQDSREHTNRRKDDERDYYYACIKTRPPSDRLLSYRLQSRKAGGKSGLPQTDQESRAGRSLVIASFQLLDSLDGVKAGLARGALVGDLAPLQDTLRDAEVAKEKGSGKQKGRRHV